MTIAMTFEDYLSQNDLDYDLVKNTFTRDGVGVADQSQLEPRKVVKCVMLEDEGGYIMAICQASKQIQLGELYREINRRLEFTAENTLIDLIGDYELGAIPPIGDLYDVEVEVVVDDELLDQDEIYFDAGDHGELIRVSAETFQKIIRGADRASFSKMKTIN